MGYFTVEVKPTIPASHLAGNSSVYAIKDVLFDWTAFQIPKGAASLMGITVVMRGKNGAVQGAHDVDFFFAKTINGVAPATMGNSNVTAAALPVVSNHILGFTRIDDAGAYGEAGFDYFSVAKGGGTSPGFPSANLVIQGEPD